MTEREDNVVPHERVRSLREAVQTARIADADRNDALEERRQAEYVRLELVMRELEGVFADALQKSDQFVFEISKGATPRLWIDATSHVVMASNIHTFRFIKDTRLGRIVLTETDVVEALADRVTAYIAERIVDQERTVEADWQIWRLNEQAQKEAAEAAAKAEAAKAAENDDEVQPSPPRQRGGGAVFFALVIGILLGGIAFGGYLQYAGLYDFRPHFPRLQSMTESAFPTMKKESGEPETTTVQTPAATPEATASETPPETAAPAE